MSFGERQEITCSHLGETEIAERGAIPAMLRSQLG
jgi:hypothetical protein